MSSITEGENVSDGNPPSGLVLEASKIRQNEKRKRKRGEGRAKDVGLRIPRLWSISKGSNLCLPKAKTISNVFINYCQLFEVKRRVLPRVILFLTKF